jgi:hypothetical protein
LNQIWRLVSYLSSRVEEILHKDVTFQPIDSLSKQHIHRFYI